MVPSCGDGDSTQVCYLSRLNMVIPSPLKLFDLAKKQGRFLYACAPMVRYSKLAFRQTVHYYGTDLCWTPMILAKEFNRSAFARDGDLTMSTLGPQPPTILQFGANSPLEISRASRLAAPFVNGVDLNCGCPQSWACAETLGAALMNRRELVRDMVVETREGLRRDGWAVEKHADVDSPKGRSVSVKIRVHDDLRKTVDFIDTVVGHPHSRNVDWITIHPRTRSTPSTIPIRTEALDLLVSKYSSTLPILLSGDVFDLGRLPFGPSKTMSLDDNLPRDGGAGSRAHPTPANTGLSGFMSARGLLSNPAMFAGNATCPWEAVERFMYHAARAPLPFLLALHHVHDMCSPAMSSDKKALLSREERAQLNRLGSMVELIDFLDDKIEQHTGQVGGLRREF
ncbi:tRNA-dihydrouridine synthase 4 [Geosmithia morbida]|uniref:tRNA-dihydrouridine synthase 4 n=1 Tax=Geosmithia morbida TaxID=1094350 RepID=A0A9P5D1D7_9HYPO|nr:tRNA-dihydrouridine synthase 4 [Geosmithia morbida]KAF4122642.1 tRNA-dihydrouridine synthase 4 [Geosmithia morbida]